VPVPDLSGGNSPVVPATGVFFCPYATIVIQKVAQQLLHCSATIELKLLSIEGIVAQHLCSCCARILKNNHKHKFQRFAQIVLIFGMENMDIYRLVWLLYRHRFHRFAQIIFQNSNRI
jgi:hypothetical protein